MKATCEVMKFNVANASSYNFWMKCGWGQYSDHFFGTIQPHMSCEVDLRVEVVQKIYMMVCFDTSHCTKVNELKTPLEFKQGLELFYDIKFIIFIVYYYYPIHLGLHCWQSTIIMRRINNFLYLCIGPKRKKFSLIASLSISV